MDMFEDFSERVITNTGVYKDLVGLDMDFANLDQQTTIDILVGNGVDLDDPTTFVIDSCEGVTGDWSDVLESTNYMVSNDMEYIGIYHKGPASTGLLIHKAEYGELTFTIVDKSGKPLHGVVPDNRNTDIIDYDDVPDDDDDDEQSDRQFMELEFVELQRYLTECKMAALDAHDEQNWYGEDWWNDKAMQAKTDFLNTYGLSWSDYDNLEQEYKRQN